MVALEVQYTAMKVRHEMELYDLVKDVKDTETLKVINDRKKIYD